jgi:hypothetical protein
MYCFTAIDPTLLQLLSTDLYGADGVQKFSASTGVPLSAKNFADPAILLKICSISALFL